MVVTQQCLHIGSSDLFFSDGFEAIGRLVVFAGAFEEAFGAIFDGG
jgi:hypothetical protein